MKMSNSKAQKLWITNVISFFLLALLAGSGLLNWMLPHGRRGVEGFLFTLRRFSCEVHTWTAFLFIIVMAVHLVLHWPYIRTNLRRSGIWK